MVAGHRRAEQHHELPLRAVRQPHAGHRCGRQRHHLRLTIRAAARSPPTIPTWAPGPTPTTCSTSSRRQTDAAGQITTVTYDLLGRITQRVEPDLTSTWTYDTAANGIGKLASAATNTGYSRAHTYDALGRPSQTQITIDGTTYAITTAYDSASRVSPVTYPSGFAVTLRLQRPRLPDAAHQRRHRPGLLDRQRQRCRAASDPADRRQRRRHQPGASMPTPGGSPASRPAAPARCRASLHL